MIARLLLLATVLALAGCAAADGRVAPAPPAGTGDPAGSVHSDWCGSNPPSGYCVVGEPH